MAERGRGRVFWRGPIREVVRAAALVLSVAAPVSAAWADPAPAPARATVPMSRQIDFTSAVDGHTYRVQIAIPYLPPPKAGYPVLYVLDGDAYFGTFASAARLRTIARELEPAVVVGIGYPDGQDDMRVVMARRDFDLTPTQGTAADLAQTKALTNVTPTYAGADQFLKVIQTEIKPRVAAAVPVDPARAMLFGHSLGGLFVLHALFTQPGAFQTWLALSPSIWWDGRVVLKDEASFSSQVATGKAAPRVFIAVGAKEQLKPDAFMMVGNATDLAGRLSGLKGPPGYVVASKVFDGQTHLSVPFASANTLLEFALPPTAAPAK